MIPQERALYVDRLIADAAISETAEKAMAVRRLFEIAKTTPEVEAYELAKEGIIDLQKTIKDELAELKYEVELRADLSSKTALSIIKQDRVRKQRGLLISGSGDIREYEDDAVDMNSEFPITIDTLRNP